MAKRKEPENQVQVRKSNVFVDGQYRFGLHEQKVLLQIVSKIRMDEREFSPYFVSWEELKRISNGWLDSEKKIDECCEKLKNKTIKVKAEDGEDNFGFLSGWKTVSGKGVYFRIDESMKSMLLDLLGDGKFTLFSLECAIALSSSHSIRFYEILKSHQWKKQPVTIPLDDIKWSLDIDPKSPTYSAFGSFRVHILEKSQKAFKEHTDISFTWKPIKAGRKVVSLEIHIKENPRYQRTIQGEAVRQETKALQPGAIVIVNGKEYEYTGSGIVLSNGAIPTGQLLQWINEGKAEIK